MQIKKLKLIILVLLVFRLSGIQAQYNINATGDNAIGNEGTASYSVGQVVYNTNIGMNGTSAQGVQQPYEISVVTAIEESKGINLSFIVYPNPTKDYLTLDVGNFDLSNLKYQLYDNNGKLIQTQIITNNKTNIVFSNLIPALYYLTVIIEKKEIKTFKIIKN